jgi:hypothetical protein
MDNQSRQSPGSTPLNANFKLQNCPNTRSSTPCGAHRFLAPTWLVGKPTRTGDALSAEERERRGSTAHAGHRTDVRRSTSRRHDEAVTAKVAPFVEQPLRGHRQRRVVCTTNVGQHTPRLLTPTRTPEPACTTPSSIKPEHADLIDRDHTGTILKRYLYQPRVARKTAISARRR